MLHAWHGLLSFLHIEVGDLDYMATCKSKKKNWENVCSHFHLVIARLLGYCSRLLAATTTASLLPTPTKRTLPQTQLSVLHSSVRNLRWLPIVPKFLCQAVKALREPKYWGRVGRTETWNQADWVQLHGLQAAQRWGRLLISPEPPFYF